MLCSGSTQKKKYKRLCTKQLLLPTQAPCKTPPPSLTFIWGSEASPMGLVLLSTSVQTAVGACKCLKTFRTSSTHGAEQEHGGEGAHLLFFFYIIISDVDFPHASPAPRKLFSFFFLPSSVSLRNKAQPHNPAPAEVWKEPGLAAGECCYSSD